MAVIRSDRERLRGNAAVSNCLADVERQLTNEFVAAIRRRMAAMNAKRRIIMLGHMLTPRSMGSSKRNRCSCAENSFRSMITTKNDAMVNSAASRIMEQSVMTVLSFPARLGEGDRKNDARSGNLEEIG